MFRKWLCKHKWLYVEKYTTRELCGRDLYKVEKVLVVCPKCNSRKKIYKDEYLTERKIQETLANYKEER